MMSKLGLAATGITAFLLGVCGCLIVGHWLPAAYSSRTLAGDEEMRVTSPNGRFDAVITREAYGGAAGGFEWFVNIVPKGKSVSGNRSLSLFQAGTLDGEKLVWTEPHRLDVLFDRAEIESYRNFWGSHEVEDVGPNLERDYLVEIRLVPSSPDFSWLTPRGDLRPRP
ncbi:MAG: hypothetical protein ACRD59_00155 [Candidatus Acidiferrales bacterium]